MKKFSYFCGWALILGCQGGTPSLAAGADMNSALLLSQKGVQAESAKSAAPTTKFQNVEGTLKEIQGDIYVVEGEDSQQTIKVQVGRDTAFPNGHKEPGQSLHALISTIDGHALIIR